MIEYHAREAMKTFLHEPLTAQIIRNKLQYDHNIDIKGYVVRRILRAMVTEGMVTPVDNIARKQQQYQLIVKH